MKYLFSIVIGLMLMCSVAWANELVIKTDDFTGTTSIEYDESVTAESLNDHYASVYLALAGSDDLSLSMAFGISSYNTSWIFPEKVFIIAENNNETKRYQLDCGRFDMYTVRYDTNVLDGGMVSEFILVLVSCCEDSLSQWSIEDLEFLRNADLRFRINGSEMVTEDVYCNMDGWEAVINYYLGD